MTPPASPQRTTVGLAWLPLRLIYGLYAASAFLGLALLALLPLALIPTLAGRRRLIQWTGRASLALMGMPVRVHWAVQLPDPCIVVANHSSYLDGVVLAAILPPRFDFVIKREMAAVPLASFLLRRIGVQFVTRGNRSGGSRDALRVIRSAARGGSLAFFPEGTFLQQPGLLRFHTGAFAAAERAGAPIMPLAILGTRHCLEPGSMLPRPGRITVRGLPLLHPLPACPDGAAALRDAARAAILAATGEIDAAEAKA
ncbi:MAG: 1-acyl-sn-glycerol-3-phosphate acyltransferase [Gammaproteobacteria bacterium]|nr:1-acyl-sn-glycerol-3-phosphate acyltransferase [Gammaproteobacteria bacterium]MDE2249851.1 1-acyl-sn-glycerol-3-phosphate acyltransferase [Gammaproteobacteria bacterium]